MSETQEEYDKRQRKRKARAIQKAEGINYTTALRRVLIEEAANRADPETQDNVELGGAHD